MIDKNRLLAFAKNDEDKILISRIIDVFLFVEEKNTVKHTGFLNGHQIALAERVASSFNVKYDFFGGYGEAERKVLFCMPEYFYPESSDIPIYVLKIESKNKAALSHRDYMGAILNLGIKREKVGDIVVFDGFAYVFCMSDIAEYIASQTEKIGNVGVNIFVSSFDEVNVLPKKFKEITSSVSSIRLDSVLCAALGISRNESNSLVEKGLVCVNWETVLKPDFRPEKGDVISVHKYGRLLFSDIGGSSKKGRTFITVKRYI